MNDANKIKAWDIMYAQHSESFFKNDDHYPQSAYAIIELMDVYIKIAKCQVENPPKTRQNLTNINNTY